MRLHSVWVAHNRGVIDENVTAIFYPNGVKVTFSCFILTKLEIVKGGGRFFLLKIILTVYFNYVPNLGKLKAISLQSML